MKKRKMVLVACLLVAALCNSCKASKTETTVQGAAEKKKTLGIIPFYRRDDFYKDLENAMVKKGEELGYNCVVQDPDGDVGALMRIIEDFVSTGVDALLLCPFAMEAMVPLLESVTAKGIPVITFDGIIDNPGKGVTCAIKFDFAQCGKVLGENIKAYVKEKGFYNGSKKLRTVVIDFPSSITVGVPIINNSLQVLIDADMIEIVARQDGKADRNTAMGVMENILTAIGNDADLLIGFNTDACFGGVRAAEERGLEGKMMAFSQLWGEEAFTALEKGNGIYRGGIAYAPTVMGESAAMMADAALKGTLTSSEFNCEPLMLTTDNISGFDWRAIVAARAK
jgi:ABC-type sugar transport system substrate-binding protein